MALPPAKRVEVPQEVLDVVRDDEQVWNTMSAEEMLRYAGQFVATRGGRVVAAAATDEELRHQLAEQGSPVVCTKHVEDPRLVIIYAVP